jgi:DNA-binding NarL/FixJ family response regulator
MTTRVLLVEDDPLLRKAIARRFSTEGASVTEFARRSETENLGGDFEFGVFDIVLPDGNGIDIAAHLLSTGRIAKAVFFTGLSDEGTLERAATFGTVVRKGEDNPVEELVRQTLDRASWTHFEPAPPSASAGSTSDDTLNVRFLPGDPGSLSILEIKTPRRHSVLPIIRGLLFDLRIQIIRAESRVIDDRITERLHIVEFDGAPISSHRHLQVQMAVLGLLETTMHAARRT